MTVDVTGADVGSAAPRARQGAAARRERILEILRETGFRTTRELSAELGVSDMTIRRDLADLDAAARVKQVYGGVMLLRESPGGTAYEIRQGAQRDAKRRIGVTAARLVTPASVVAFDSGTTTLEVLNNLEPGIPLTIATASLPLINAASQRPEIDVTALGGALHPELQAFAGPLTLASIEQLRFTTLFLAASAVRSTGVYCANQYDALTKRALIAVSDRVILLVDSKKFGHDSVMMKVASLEQVDAVVVDDGISDEHRQYLQLADVEIILAETTP